MITTAIMAGGKSSRMGRDKSFVLVDGRPLIERIVEKVTGLGEELILITNKPDEYAHLGLPMFGDVYLDQGSLGGIFTAVHYASYPHTLVAACDMPWLNRPLLEYMLTLRETADVVVPRWADYPEPLHAVYSKVCLRPIEAKLQAGKLKITGFYDEVKVHYLDREAIARFDPEGRSFANLNTPDELAAAQSTS
jgi:molybdopterin-guanine dinucleotide biosynthesis protein A